MKKFLLLFLAVGVLSCSDDDDNNNGGSSNQGGSIVVTIDGQTKTFNNVVVNEQDIPADGPDYPAYTELTVTGQIGNSTSEVITFMLPKGMVGSNAIYSFDYVTNNVMYNGDPVSVVQTNNNSKKIKGNFSGIISRWDNDLQQNVSKTITDGSFDVQY